MPPTITTATDEDLDDLLPLFAGYQHFYAQEAQEESKNRAYLQRLMRERGRILVARAGDGAAVGFANLFWIHSSISAEDQILLGDLYVDEAVRGQGTGRQLIDAAAGVARERGSKSLVWQTALDNRRAQRLYESTGAERSAWFEYELTV